MSHCRLLLVNGVEASGGGVGVLCGGVPYSVSPYAQLDALAEFREWLGVPVSTENVDAFVSESPDRAALLSGAIVGSIRWARSLGVPQTTTRSGAFLVEQFITILAYRTAEGEVWAPIKQDEAVLWDGPDDDSHHRVTYFLPDSHGAGSTYGNTSVTVKLPQVWWPRTPPHTGPPRLRPAGWEFAATGQGVRVLTEHELYVNRSDTFDPLRSDVPLRRRPARRHGEPAGRSRTGADS